MARQNRRAGRQEWSRLRNGKKNPRRALAHASQGAVRRAEPAGRRSQQRARTSSAQSRSDDRGQGQETEGTASAGLGRLEDLLAAAAYHLKDDGTPTETLI